MRKSGKSFWAYLGTMFLVAGLALAVLPGCGDDTVDSDSDSEFDSEMRESPAS
jgi:hypothetical protein